MHTLYKLDDNGEPVPCDDVVEWARWFESAVEERVIAHTQVRDQLVSTIFLGVDHGFGFGGGPPVLFETMILGGPEDEAQWRYSTRAEAVDGHLAAVALADAARPFDLGRNVVHMHSYRLVRRYTSRKKCWAVFDGTSRAPVAYIVKTGNAGRHWQLLPAVAGVNDVACRYLSQCILFLRRDLNGRRAQETIRELIAERLS